MQGGGVPRQLGCATLVVMVESTDVGKLDNLKPIRKTEKLGTI